MKYVLTTTVLGALGLATIMAANSAQDIAPVGTAAVAMENIETPLISQSEISAGEITTTSTTTSTPALSRRPVKAKPVAAARMITKKKTAKKRLTPRAAALLLEADRLAALLNRMEGPESRLLRKRVQELRDKLDGIQGSPSDVEYDDWMDDDFSDDEASSDEMSSEDADISYDDEFEGSVLPGKIFGDSVMMSEGSSTQEQVHHESFAPAQDYVSLPPVQSVFSQQGPLPDVPCAAPQAIVQPIMQPIMQTVFQTQIVEVPVYVPYVQPRKKHHCCILSRLFGKGCY